MTIDREPAEVEVLIVGMGPTGAALAGLLGQRGVRTMIIDRSAELYPLPRAVGIDHEVLRIAQELGIVDALVDHVAPYRASEYRGVDGHVIKRLDSPPPPYRLGWAPMYAFDQPAFETALRARVATLPAVTVALESEVMAVGQDRHGAWADVRRTDESNTSRIRADYLVACDGGTSAIRASLGIELTDLGFHEPWLVVDALIDDDEVLARLPQTQVQYCDPTRPATFVNLVGRHRRWEIALEPGELPAGPVDQNQVWRWLERWVRPGEARIWRAAAYVFHGLVAAEWRRGRIFLAGDSAHMTPPFMAQGMAQGMRDAQNLAWKLHAALRHNAADELLDTYGSERRSFVMTTTRNTIELGRIICERDASVARDRDRQMLALHHGEVPVTYRSHFLPPLTDGLLCAESPGSGEVLPQPFVRRGDRRVMLDDVTGAGFRAVTTSDIDAGDSHRLKEALAPLDGLLVRLTVPGDARGFSAEDDVSECDDVMASWLRSVGRRIAIVRPDHYVYGTAHTTEEAIVMVERLRSRFF